MFTIEQINAAHSKVKSGADFPAYIQEIIQLGVSSYETWVSDGHTVYSDNVQSDAKYGTLMIAEKSNVTAFRNDLKIHQQGGTDYLTFSKQAAASGVEKWVVRTDKMTCTYYNKTGDEMLTERIPALT